jgi:8-oxo-dGTP diphosphatase
MFAYTLGFIRRKNQILMVNREKKPWLGSWNGVGGKLDKHESGIACIIREIEEETDIVVTPDQVHDKGFLTWNSFDANGQGLHIFLIDLPEDYTYVTPRQVEEGILDWKEIDWIISMDNYGVAHNIPYFLPTVLSDPQRYHYHCIFEGRNLISVERKVII